MTPWFIGNRWFWLMLVDRQPSRYVKAELPCMKGEIVVPLGAKSLVAGWQLKHGS